MAPNGTSEFTLDLEPGAVKKAMEGLKSADTWNVPIGQIVVIDGFNVRPKDDEYYAARREYADSMKLTGFMRSKPLTVFIRRVDGVDQVVVVDGHTRLDSAHLAVSEGAAIVTIPCITTAAGTSMEDLTVALINTNNGRPLSPYAKAQVCKRLINFGMDEAEIANRLSFTPTYVSSLLALMAAPRAVHDMVVAGKVSATLAIETLKTHGKEASAVLKAATDKAETAGKQGRITKKDVTEKPVKAPKPTKRDVLAEGVDWMVKNAATPDADKRFAELLAFACGVSFNKVVAAVAEREEEKKLKLVAK